MGLTCIISIFEVVIEGWREADAIIMILNYNIEFETMFWPFLLEKIPHTWLFICKN